MAMHDFTSGEVLTAANLDIYCVNTITALKTANESVTSSTTLQNDDHLVLALAANSTYEVRGILITDGATGGDIKLSFPSITSATITLHIVGPSLLAASGTDVQSFLYETFGSSASFGTLGAADHRPISFEGVVDVAGTAGNLQLQWAQDTSSGTATRILQNSAMWAHRIS